MCQDRSSTLRLIQQTSTQGGKTKGKKGDKSCCRPKTTKMNGNNAEMSTLKCVYRTRDLL